MLSSRKIFAGARVLLVLLLLWAGTHFSVAQSFSFPRLRLAATNGLTNRVFTAGDRVVPEVTVSNGVWYRVTVRDAVNVVKNPGAVCTPTTLFSSSDNSYTVQPGDAPTTNGTYKFIVETFPGDACNGTPINSATQQFYVVTAAAFTNANLTAPTNRFVTNQTAYLRLDGLPPNTTNWSFTWFLPGGGASCAMTTTTNRPTALASQRLPSFGYIAYPPANTFSNVWNRTTNYDGAGGCAGFTGNQGDWQIGLQLNSTSFVTLRAFTVSNDCFAPTVTLTNRAVCPTNATSFAAATNGTGPFTFVWRKDGAVIPVVAQSFTISSVNVSTTGVYTVEVTGPCGSATNSGTLSINTLLTAQALPNQTACSGNTVIWIAPTNGSGPFTFQWRRNGNAISSATNQTFVLNNIPTTSNGTYSVIINGPCNSLTNSGTLTVNVGVTSTALTNLVRYVGTFASFSTLASGGSGPITYAWSKDGGLLPGQTNRSLMLSNLALADSGTYTVVASAGCTSTNSATLLVAYCFNSLDVMLVIDRSASMLGQLSNGVPYRDARTAATNFVRNLVLGTNADLVGLASYNRISSLNHVLTNSAPSVEAAIHALPPADGGTCISCGLNTAQAELTSIRHRVGALPVMVLLTDGVPKTNDNDSVSQVLSNALIAKLAGTRIFTMGLNDGSGTNVDQALLASAASSTNDFFYVNDSSQLTAVFDQISAILCRGPNSIEGPTPSNAVVCAGQTVQFDVTATGCAIFTFEWRHDGVPLLGQTNPSLILPNVTNANSGVYSVVISSFCGTITNSATLVVNSPAQILIGPQSQSPCAGANVNFNVLASGTGLTYQWWRGITPLPGQTNTTLSLTNVTPADAGTYLIRVVGVCGGMMTSQAALTVRTPPALTALTNVFACPGQPVILQTATNGTGPLSILWRRGGIVISGANSPALNLGAADSSTAGTYAVEVSGPCGSATNTALVVVLTNTAATLLVNQERCAGGAAEFNTTAEGTGPFTFVWRHNGAIIPGADTATLSFPSTTTNDSGSYTVAVTGACGTVTRGALLTVRAPTTATPLAGAEVCAGEAASFSTVAQGAGPFTFAWRHDGVLIDGATNSTLSLSSLSLTNAGIYSVEVTGACNSVTNSATLLVRALTTATPLANATRCAGESVTFSTTADGTAPLTFVWRREGVELPGEISATLTRTNLSTADAGIYSVEVTGACGVVTNAATLTVLELITATPLADATACEGETVSFHTVASGTGPFTYVWRHGGTVTEGATNSTLTLTNAGAADAGPYSVEVTGVCNAVTNFATLAVRLRTAFSPIEDALACAGESLSVGGFVSGTGPFTLVWRRNGVVLPGQTNEMISLEHLTTNDTATYAVEVTGACNSVTNTFALVVQAPTTVAPLTNLLVCAGVSASFHADTAGTGPFTWQWRHDGVLLPFATEATLTLTNLTPADAGFYTVMVAGECGVVTRTARVDLLQFTAATPLAGAVRCAGEAVDFNTTISGSGPWQIVWRRNGNVLPGETNSSLTLASVTTNDAGLYSVEISGVCNAVTNSAALTVNSPVTATPLADASVCAGGSITFQTTPGGTGPWTFVWRHDAAVLADATNSSLTLTNLSALDAGAYSVEVSGVCGRVTNSATLTVLQLTAATPLTNLTVCAGQPVSFATTASGSGPWTFVWRRNGTALLNETNSALALASVSTNDAGIYSAEVSGPCNTVTNVATLTVNALTTVSPLADATVCAGALIFLSVQVEGAGPHYYFWRRNGQLIITTPGLIISSATVADSGLYSVEVIGACNRVTNFATITVRALTTVAPLTNAVRCAGGSLSFNAITGGTGLFTYGWWKNGIALPGETNAVLSLNTLTTNDAAIYSVQVTGACNVVTRSATLVVNEQVLAAPLTDAERCVGEPVNFTTVISGTGPLTIQWRKDGVALAGETNSSLAFTVTSTNDAGNYAVEITGACGAVTNHATLTVHPPITLGAVPDQVVCEGGSVTLSSGLNGSGMLAFVWRKDGAVISSATNGTLSFTNLSLTNSGAYQVEVASPCVVLTNVMQFTVAAPPLALINEARCVGSAVVFAATASTNAPFTFAWRHDGVLLPGETNSTLVLSALTTNAGGVYSVEVNGACGRVTNSAALTMLRPPSIAPLANQAQCAGANVTFNAVVSGSGPFTFAWRKDGALISGATNSSLNFTNVTPADTALYSVEVAGVCSAAANAATLTVSTVPVIAALTNFPVCLGQNALLAPVITGVGEFTKLWRKDGVPLSGETNATLFLGAVSNATAGIYTLEVSGACGRATNHTTLVPRTNAVVAALSNQTVCAGGAATFSAQVTGTGPFTFVWKKNGAVLSNVTSSQLALTNLFPSDAALYTVEVTTFCNTATASALLTVESSLTATPLTNLTACFGQNVTFSTTASGGPPFTYQWRRDGSALTNQTNATLVLTNVQLTNAGNYSVEVTGCGRATNSAQLAVTPPVTAALPPVITACACDDLTLTPTNLAPGSYTFAWRKNGALLAGETNAGLYLSMLNMHSPGNYSVEISGPCNSLTLQTALEVINVNSGLWTNSDGAITMRDLNTALPYPSTNLVRCAPKTISQLRVTLLGLSHGFPDDMDIALIAPNGQGIKLMSDSGGAGGNALNNVTLVFDDAAPGFLPNGGFINPGAYRPTDAFEGGPLADSFPAPGPGTNFSYATNLAAFLGSNPNGTWKLFVLDDHGGQQGVLTRWVLDFGRAEFVFPSVRLTLPVTQTNGALQMELHGEPGKTYFLEASTNLLHWMIIQTNQLNAATMTLTDFTAPQFNYRFYRASGCRE